MEDKKVPMRLRVKHAHKKVNQTAMGEVMKALTETK
jgi:hypothetical protein